MKALRPSRWLGPIYQRQDPIIVSRWVLTLKWLGFVLIGLAAAWASIPVIQDSTSPDYVTWWGLWVAGAGTICTVASLRKRWEVWERWGSLILVASLSIYTYLAFASAVVDGDSRRASLAFVLLTLSITPTARALQLLRRTGLGKEARK